MEELAYGQGYGASFGLIASPTAGQTIVTLASGNLPAGTYNVWVYTRQDTIQGTPTQETDALSKNMEVRAGATVLRNRLNSTVQPGGVVELTGVQLNGSTALTINATANATALARYCGILLASKVG